MFRTPETTFAANAQYQYGERASASAETLVPQNRSWTDSELNFVQTPSTTVSPAENRTRASRTVYTPQQVTLLEQAYSNFKFATGPRRKEVAHRIGVEEAQVKIWFKNRRAKDKKSTVATNSNKSGLSTSVKTSTHTTPVVHNIGYNNPNSHFDAHQHVDEVRAFHNFAAPIQNSYTGQFWSAQDAANSSKHLPYTAVKPSTHTTPVVHNMGYNNPNSHFDGHQHVDEVRAFHNFAAPIQNSYTGEFWSAQDAPNFSKHLPYTAVKPSTHTTPVVHNIGYNNPNSHFDAHQHVDEIRAFHNFAAPIQNSYTGQFWSAQDAANSSKHLPSTAVKPSTHTTPVVHNMGYNNPNSHFDGHQHVDEVRAFHNFAAPIRNSYTGEFWSAQDAATSSKHLPCTAVKTSTHTTPVVDNMGYNNPNSHFVAHQHVDEAKPVDSFLKPILNSDTPEFSSSQDAANSSKHVLCTEEETSTHTTPVVYNNPGSHYDAYEHPDDEFLNNFVKSILNFRTDKFSSSKEVSSLKRPRSGDLDDHNANQPENIIESPVMDYVYDTPSGLPPPKKPKAEQLAFDPDTNCWFQVL